MRKFLKEPYNETGGLCLPMLNRRKHILLAASFSQFLVMQNWFSFSAILPSLNQILNLSAKETGLALGMFQGGYILAILFWSVLSDKFNPRNIMFLSCLIVAFSGILFINVELNFPLLILLRLLAGAGIGGLYVPGMKLLSGLYPPAERGGALGFYVGSLVLGSAFSFIVAGWLVKIVGWQKVILVYAGAALVAAVIIFTINYRFVPARNPYTSTLKTLKKLAANRPAVLVNTSYVGHNWELYGMWGWIGPFMVSVFLAGGYDFEAAVTRGNLYAGLMIAIGALASFSGGRLSDRWGRIPVARGMLFSSLFFSLTFGWLIGQPVWLVVFLGLIYGFVIVGDSPVYSTSLTELTQPEYHGLVLGLQSFTGFAVTVVSPVLFGYILDLTNGQPVLSGQGQTIWGWAFMCLALGPLAGVWCLTRLRRVKSQEN